MNELGRERSRGDDWRGGSRVAFFGGSFDPPHLGHLAVARAARVALRLDRVFFAPVGTQPLKREGSAASFAQRLAMTRLAIEGEPGFEVSLADAPKPSGEHNLRPNYTIDTLEKLRATLAPECTLFCLMGADSFLGLRRWHRAAEVPFVASLIVASRPGQPPGLMVGGLKAALPPGLSIESAPGGDETESDLEVRAFVLVNRAGDRAPFYVLPGLDVDISASEIREGIRAKIHNAAADIIATNSLLPPAVAGYIRSHGLYRGSGFRGQGSGGKGQ